MKHPVRAAALSLFALLLAIPLLLTLFGVQGGAEAEEALKPPRLSDGYSAFFADSDAHYRSTFPLRQTLVKWNAFLSWKLLGTAPGDEVIAGRHGFLFLADTAKDFTSERQLPEEELQALAQTLGQIEDALAERGTAFVFAVAPNKSSVYPEYMPNTYGQGENTLYDRLLLACQSAGVTMPDLKAALVASKGEGRLYSATDTHWNDLGALVAYRAIRCAAGASWDAYEGLRMGTKSALGDLSGTMLGLDIREKVPDCGLSAFLASESDFYARELGTEGLGGDRLLVLRDSFGTALVPYLAQATQRAFFTRLLPYDFTEGDGADVVILEIAERNLEGLLPELSVPKFPENAEPEPAEPVGAEPEEIGSDIPEPEPLNKGALPDTLEEVPETADAWDEYDPFGEPPGQTAGQIEEPETDLAAWQLLCVPGQTEVGCTVLGQAQAGTLQCREEAGGAALTADLRYQQFKIEGLKAGTNYVARAVVDGVTLDFRFATQPRDAAAADWMVEAIESGLSFAWQGKDGLYRIWRSDFSEGEETLVAELEGKQTLLPYSGRVQAHYRVAFVENGLESGSTGQAALYTPLLEPPSIPSEKAIEGQELYPVVSRAGQMIFLLRRDIDGAFSVPVRAMLTSTGKADERTPLGTYRVWKKLEWLEWAEGQYSQHNLFFSIDLKIHSVLFKERNHDTPIYSMRERLGSAVSGGCLRLTVTDARWLYDRMETEYRFTILDGPRYPTLKTQLKATLPE